MGQAANERRVKENEARAMAKYLRTSPQKLNLVAQTIRGKDAGKALIDLEFSSRRIAQDVRKVLQSAVSNAENNHGLDVDKLYVAEAYVGKSITMKRWRARARGRAARIEKPFSRLTVVVRERDGDATKAPAKKAPAKKTEAKKAAPKSGEAKKEAPKKEEAKKEQPKKKAAAATPKKSAAPKKESAKKAPAKSAPASKSAATRKTAPKGK